MEEPDLSALLKDAPGENQLKVTKVLQNKANKDNLKIQAWSSMFEDLFKLVYQASADIINVGSGRPRL